MGPKYDNPNLLHKCIDIGYTGLAGKVSSLEVTKSSSTGRARGKWIAVKATEGFTFEVNYGFTTS